MDIAYDPHNLALRGQGVAWIRAGTMLDTEHEVLTDRIAPREIFAGERLVDDDNRWRVVPIIGLGVQATAQQRNRERVKIPGRHPSQVGHRLLAGRGRWLADDVEPGARVEASECRKGIGIRDAHIDGTW